MTKKTLCGVVSILGLVAGVFPETSAADARDKADAETKTSSHGIMIARQLLKTRLQPGEKCPMVVSYVNTTTNTLYISVRKEADFGVYNSAGFVQDSDPMENTLHITLSIPLIHEEGKAYVFTPVWHLEPHGGAVSYVTDALVYYHGHLAKGVYSFGLPGDEWPISVVDKQTVFVRTNAPDVVLWNRRPHYTIGADHCYWERRIFPWDKTNVFAGAIVSVPVKELVFSIVGEDEGDDIEKGTLERKTRTVDLGDGVMLELVWIPAGTFIMGSPSGEKGRRDDEGPQHPVMISKGFWMGQYPVTQRQYQRLTGRKPSHFAKAGMDAPVETVAWHDAKQFCGKVQERLSGDLRGLTVRLPTEAEWEFACRAGTTTALHHGKDLTATNGICSNLDEIAWYNANSDEQTRPAGQKKANAWGLYGVLGNVWEWCEDSRRDYTAEDMTDPRGSGSSRMIRGGSWYNRAGLCRAACRADHPPVFHSFNLGFRVVVQ